MVVEMVHAMRFTGSTLLISMILLAGFADTAIAQAPPSTSPINLVAGVGGPVSEL